MGLDPPAFRSPAVLDDDDHVSCKVVFVFFHRRTDVFDTGSAAAVQVDIALRIAPDMNMHFRNWIIGLVRTALSHRQIHVGRVEAAGIRADGQCRIETLVVGLNSRGHRLDRTRGSLDAVGRLFCSLAVVGI